MCQQSLINYLHTELNKGTTAYQKIGDSQTDAFGNKVKVGQFDLTEEHKSIPQITKEDLETLIKYGEHVGENEAIVETKGKETTTYSYKLPESIRKHAELIDEKLANIKVCDPAIGSGAFPVGMMHEIVKTRNVLTAFIKNPNRTIYNFKRECIEKSLYGVDIDPGAVEIAKLRLWLSLVVDEDDIKNIKPLPNLDYKIVCGNSLLSVEKNLFNNQLFAELEHLKPLYFNETNPTKKQEYKQQIDSLISQITDGHKEFDFEVYFSEVFHEKGGFDVVIANPPYVSVEKFARTAQQAEFKRRFKTYASRGDIYCFFYERGLCLLRDAGVLTFISSNKFQRAGYGKGLRQLLATQRIETLMDFCELPVFVAAADPMIVIVVKAVPPPDHEFPVVVIKDEFEISSLPQSLAARGTLYKTKQLKADGWSLEGGEGLTLVEKLQANRQPLGEYIGGTIMAGIKTGYNKAFWVDTILADHFRSQNHDSAKQFLKPMLTGDDARRWIAKPITKFLIYTPRGTSENQLGALKTHLSQWRKRLEQRALDQKWYELQQAQYRYSQTYGRPKIVYPDIALEPRFSLDKLGRYPDMTAFSIPLAEPWLVAILNSNTSWFFLCRTASVLGDADNRGRVRCKTQYVSRIPIPAISEDEKSHLSKLAERAAKLAEAGNADGLQKIELEINHLVYKLFGLTEEEIKIVKSSS